jgi:paraquat-inducible protein B
MTSSKEKLSKVIFKEMEVGKVVDSYYDIKSDKQILTVKLKNRFAYILKNSPNFYINTPKLDIENINLKNIIKSPFIEVNIKNKKSEIKDSYVLNSFIPVRDGYEFSFQTKSDVFKGDKIKYRGVEVGEVSEVNIKNSSLLIKAKIYKEYKSLINNSTYFYKLSAVEMKASLKESYINFSNAKEAVFGGIGFITPKKNKLTKKEFLLFDSKEKLKKYLYSKDGGKFITILVSNLDFIKNGTSINYKGFSIGEVISYKLNSKINLIEVEVYIKKEYRNLINKSTKFFKDSGVDVSIGFDGVKVASKPIEGFVNGVISMKSSLNKEDFTSRFKLLTKEELTKENYFFVNVIMSDGFDLKVGSKLMFKSLKIGEVEKISLDNNITASVKIDKKYKKYFGQNSKIWLENLKLGVQGIKNLSAPILGSNLYLLSDEENGFKDRFILDSITPADTKYLKGLRILLKAKLRGSLKIDAPVYYRRVVIGQIEHIDLSSDGKFVDVKIFIYPQYSHFIRKNTHFYNTSIMGMEVGLFSAKLSIGTLETLFKGGVEIATPDNAGELATNGELFYLKNENHEDWLKWEPDLDLKGE